MVLLPEPIRPGGMDQQLVRALTDLRMRVAEELRLDVVVDREPALPCIV